MKSHLRRPKNHELGFSTVCLWIHREHSVVKTTVSSTQKLYEGRDRETREKREKGAER